MEDLRATRAFIVSATQTEQDSTVLLNLIIKFNSVRLPLFLTIPKFYTTTLSLTK